MWDVVWDVVRKTGIIVGDTGVDVRDVGVKIVL